VSVLIVEDDTDVRQSLAALIRRRGYSAATAADGQEALENLRPTPVPCLILLDPMMPRMDGWQLRAAMLEDPDPAPIPVVLLSAIADVESTTESLRAVDYLRKPVDFDRLYELLGSYRRAPRPSRSRAAFTTAGSASAPQHPELGQLECAPRSPQP
jgi:CheY-like chemotaxis protein